MILEKRKKPGYRLAAVTLVLAFLAGPIFKPAAHAYVMDGGFAAEEAVTSMNSLTAPRDVAFTVGRNDFLVPMRAVSAVQLYSFQEGKGFPALESVIAARKTWKVSLGAAAEIGTGVNVPFLSVSTRLSPRFFDTGNNDLYFGVWVGKPSKGEKTLWGLSASTALW